MQRGSRRLDWVCFVPRREFIVFCGRYYDRTTTFDGGSRPSFGAHWWLVLGKQMGGYRDMVFMLRSEKASTVDNSGIAVLLCHRRSKSPFAPYGRTYFNMRVCCLVL